MAKQPNVLFLFSDQQRFDTVSCYGRAPGAGFALTPNLDRLAARGTRFDSAFTCQPVCGPARACIQTGKYPSQIGCQINDRMLPLGERTIAHCFNDAGYETAYVGKWHLASHNSFGSGPDSVNYKTTAIPPAYRGGYRDYWVAADVLEFTSHGYGGYMFDGDGNRRAWEGYRVDATTDFALEYLRAPKEKPFFLFVSYIEPHHQNDRNRYEGPDGSKERYAGFEVPGDLEGTAGDWREQMPDYLGCCASLDENVGRILKTLEERGLLENTVIFYTADHGTHFKTRNSEYKRSCHDDSTHVPFIAAGPGFEGGHVATQLTSLIDIAPTLLRCAGIGKPDYMPGVAMQELLEHPGRPIHDGVFIQISESCIGRALRTPDYIYCAEAPGEHTPEFLAQPGSDLYIERYFYDLKSDEYQRRNLAGDPRYAAIREELRGRLLDAIEREEGLRPEIRPA